MTAEIAVAAAVIEIDKPYEYSVPESLSDRVMPGVRVIVPFGAGNRRTEGIVLFCGCGSGRTDIALKQIEAVLDDAPVLDAVMLRLAAFLRERYFCTFFEAVRAMLPAGLWYRKKNTIVLTDLGRTADPEKELPKSKIAAAALYLLQDRGGEIEEQELSAVYGAEAERALRTLRRRKFIIAEGKLLRKTADKTESIAELAVSPEEAQQVLGRMRRSPMQREILRLLITVGSCAVKDITYFTGAGRASILALEKAGTIRLYEQEVFRTPSARKAAAPQPISLAPEQEAAYQVMQKDLAKGRGVHLLYGVTGSGKTAVYLRLIEDTLRAGKSALVLVPEISLTPQMLALFTRQFGSETAVLHSSLRITQRYDEWKRIRDGKAHVVIGTRSAIFAPLSDLGLIIIDEEHESTYKSGQSPRYHAREVAIWRGKQERALVVLGSATPSIESMYLAQSGVYHLEKLMARYNGRKMPDVRIADLRRDLRDGDINCIGTELSQELERNLIDCRQTILYLNRRGTSRSVVCPVCSHVPMCPHCSVSLTYHAANNRLMCHYCGFSQPMGSKCPECGGEYQLVGAGTQRVEEEIHARWPQAETIRMDADTVSAANPHEKILSRFQNEQIPVLIGTQMVTKGLNFPNVTLVGVVDADSSLYLDDYRASEVTFQKITQVVGRSGRGTLAGRAVIQTCTPENEILHLAARQDYDAFYEAECKVRQLRYCPPFADLFQFRLSGRIEGDTAVAALDVREALRAALARDTYGRTILMGPSPEAVPRIRGRWRYQVSLLARNTRPLRKMLRSILCQSRKSGRGKNVYLTVVVNPMD